MEENSNKDFSKERKVSLILLVIVIIILLLVIGGLVFYIVSKENESDEKLNQQQVSEEKIKDNIENEEISKEENETNENLNKQDTLDEKVEEKSEYIVKEDELTYDLANLILKEGYAETAGCDFYDEYYGIYLEGKNGEFTLSYSYDSLNEYYGISGTGSKSKKILGINSKEVKQILLFKGGHAITVPNVYFLMKDGTVKKIDVKDVIDDKNFTVKNIENVKDVEIMIKCSYYGLPTGHIAVRGLCKDGTYYDLY